MTASCTDDMYNSHVDLDAGGTRVEIGIRKGRPMLSSGWIRVVDDDDGHIARPIVIKVTEELVAR